MMKPRECYKLNKNPVDQNERDKMTKFLENGDFYDVVIRVEGKTHKLHRCKLLSESGYFANVFSTEINTTSGQKNKYEEYSLDVQGVDESSFDVSIRYIYYKKLELNPDTIVGILKTASVLKIESLIDDCESWIISKLREISFEIVVEILNFIRNANLIVRFEHVYKCLLCQRILTAWSAMDDFSLFYTISIDMLEDLLITSALHVKVDDSSLPENFGFDDPDKWLDICSKWVMGDVQNRYNFIPRIALAINCNINVNCNDYKMKTTLNTNNCSEQIVRDQLLLVLLSTQLIARHTLLKNIPREIKDDPVFVTSSRTMVRILNAEMDEVMALWHFKDDNNNGSLNHGTHLTELVSATTMGDTLFIAANVAHNNPRRIFFQAYNISSKKFTSLAYIPQIGRYPTEFQTYVLLNIRDDIYCCFYGGLILKYVMHLNRWTKFTKSERSFKFASDGKILYRFYQRQIEHEHSQFFCITDKYFETYDFDRNIWILVPEMTILGIEKATSPEDFIIMNNGDVALLFFDTFWIFDRNSRSWRQLPLPEQCCNRELITQWEDRLLLLFEDQLYYYQLSDPNQSWQVKKKVSFYRDCPVKQSFRCVKSVHKPIN